MGKLILCHGKQAEIPYHFELTDTNLYSVEELCYYIYHNIYLINETTFKLDLVTWIADETDRKDIAEKLEERMILHSNMKDIIVTILCGTDYFTEEEIKELIKIINEICGLPLIRRRKIKADNYMKYKKYQEAAREYAELLNEKEAAIFTKEEFGDMKHNEAIIKLHTASFLDAAKTFYEAFGYNQKEESLKAYLFTLKLGKFEKEFEQALSEYNVPPELLLEINQEIDQGNKMAEDSPLYEKLKKAEKMKSEGKVNEYYKEIDRMMEQWKKEYRQNKTPESAEGSWHGDFKPV